MAMFEDKPLKPVITDDNGNVASVEAPKQASYKGLKDTNDYGHSDNEDQFNKRKSRMKKYEKKEMQDNEPCYESDETVKLTKDHQSKKFGKTRVK